MMDATISGFRRMDDFDFQRTGRQSYYPWEEIFDGSVWTIEAADLKSPPADETKEEVLAALNRFRRTAYAAAKARGYTVQTQIRQSNIVLQAAPKDG